MRSRLCAGALLLALLTSSVPAAGSDGYRPVEKIDGLVFPVARSDWFSVINFTDDWHAPRFRRTDGRWALVGRHEGNDIFAEPGTPVVAVIGGTVTNLGWLFYSGWRVGIRGDDGRYWFYAHLRRYARDLSVGDRVEAGSVLGEVGNTGYGTEPGHSGEFTYHLHLGIQAADGTWVNPYPLMKRIYRRTTR
jgi:peptidoglycan LD-endopeptidase LytH